jgi:hypothetical protein
LKNLLTSNPNHRISAINALYLPIFSPYHEKLKEKSLPETHDPADIEPYISDEHVGEIRSLMSLEKKSIAMKKPGIALSDGLSVASLKVDSPEKDLRFKLGEAGFKKQPGANGLAITSKFGHAASLQRGQTYDGNIEDKQSSLSPNPKSYQKSEIRRAHTPSYLPEDRTAHESNSHAENEDRED